MNVKVPTAERQQSQMRGWEKFEQKSVAVFLKNKLQLIVPIKTGVEIYQINHRNGSQMKAVPFCAPAITVPPMVRSLGKWSESTKVRTVLEETETDN